MSTSPDRADDGVLRGTTADAVPAARFDADLSSAASPISTRPVDQAARTAGYAEGWAQGQRAARVAAQAAQDQAAAARRAEQVEHGMVVRRAVDALVCAADDLASRTAPAISQIEDLVLRTAVDLAEVLIGHELTTGADRDEHALRRAMSAAPGAGPVTVRLHPDDYRTLHRHASERAVADDEDRRVVLVPDVDLRPGDAVAETGSSTVDATLEAAVARVRQVLGL
jgi:flagellar assembly protein FliH